MQGKLLILLTLFSTYSFGQSLLEETPKIRSIQFFYQDSAANEQAMQELGFEFEGQLISSCGLPQGWSARGVCHDEWVTDYESYRTFTLGTRVSIPVDGGGININQAKISLVDMEIAAYRRRGIFHGTKGRNQMLNIEYLSGNESKILNVQVPLSLVSLDLELQYRVTKNGVLKVLFGGDIDPTVGYASINTVSDYSKANVRLSYGGYVGFQLGNRLRVTTGRGNALNSNIIDRDVQMNTDITYRVSNKVHLSGSYGSRRLELSEESTHPVQSEHMSRLRFGARVNF